MGRVLFSLVLLTATAASAERMGVAFSGSGAAPKSAALAALKPYGVTGVVDLSAEWEAVFHVRVGHIDAPVPDGFPEEARDLWVRGTANCRTRALPPYGSRNKEALRCGARLSSAIWERVLRAKGLKRAITLLQTGGEKPGKIFTVDLDLWTIDAPCYTTVSKRSAAPWENTWAEALCDVMTGRGIPIPFHTGIPEPREPPVKRSGSGLKPVEAEVCAGTPSRIDVRARTPEIAGLAETLSLRWRESVSGASGAPLSCELEHEASLLLSSGLGRSGLGPPSRPYQFTLRCARPSGARLAATGAGYGPAPSAWSVQSMATRKLIEELAAASCRDR
jgi:hypothetical protein